MTEDDLGCLSPSRVAVKVMGEACLVILVALSSSDAEEARADGLKRGSAN